LKLNILHISASYIPAYIYGGPTMSVSQLAENLVHYGKQNVSVYTTTANGKTELEIIPNIIHLINGVKVTYFKRITKDHSHFSPKLYIALWQNIRQFDIIHLHAWWHLVSIFAGLICIVKNKKFILSPRGTLSNYSFNNRSSLLKKSLHFLVGKFILNKAHFLLTSKNEEESINKLLEKKVGTHILPNFVKRRAPTLQLKLPELSTLKILFLSRIEEKKGIEILLTALKNFNYPYILSLAGYGEEEYISQLKKLSIKTGVDAYCTWLGQISTENKFDLYNQHHLLVLPSHNENFANVVIESLSVGTAVIISPEVGLADYVLKNKLGWVCARTATALHQQLVEIIDNPQQLIRIKQQAPNIIFNDFEEEKLSEKYIEYYEKNL